MDDPREKFASWLSEKKWLPYLAAFLGIVFSISLWHFLKLDAKTHTIKIESYHPLIALLLGISISILIALLIRVTQIAEQRADRLKKINEDLTTQVTEKNQLEESKQKLEIAMLQGQKLQAIGTLSSGIAHDFNNLLYAIIGYTEMARQDVPEDSLLFKNLGKVLEATQRGQELISRLLAFSRRQHHEYSAIDLTSTIDAVLSLLRPTIPASVIVDFHHESVPNILGNQTEIHQMLVNLITNAVDAMDGEGKINIDLVAIESTDVILQQFPALPQQTYCKLEIADTGQGMDQLTMKRIFEPFFTTKEVGKGTGLGLSIVHSLIKGHQGDIQVKSKLGKGSTFIILLPALA